jgi:VanZ family protein
MGKKRYIDGRSLAIAAAMLVIMVYASLYPFRLRRHPDPAGSLHALLLNSNTAIKPTDVLANVLFYVPLGLFFARSFIRSRPAIKLVLATSTGLLLSFAMESLQFYIVGRYAAMSDVFSDGAGALLGAIAACFTLRLRLPVFSGLRGNRFAALLLLSWLGSRLFPYVPVLDLHKYWDALKPLVFAPVLPPVDLFRHAVSWLAVALLLEELWGVARSRVVLALLLPAVLFGRILVARIVLSPAEVLGGVSALLAWVLLSRLRTRAIIITVLFVTGVVLQSLEPFQFNGLARAFGWTPFRSFLIGPIGNAVISFFEKVFVYGSLIWLLTRSGCSWFSSTVWATTLVMTLRLIQVYLPGRSAEITDAIMVVIIAGIMRLISDPRLEKRPAPQSAPSVLPS